MQNAIKIILHYSRGLQQTCSGHWAYNGHVLYNFVALRAIKGLEMRAEAERFASVFLDDLSNRTIEIREEAERIAKGESDLVSTRLVTMEVAICRKDVLDCLKPGIQLPDHKIEALISFAHSIGMPNFAHSGTLKAINLGEPDFKAADLMGQWNKVNTMGLPYYQAKQEANKKFITISELLTARRKTEKQLFLTGSLVLS